MTEPKIPQRLESTYTDPETGIEYTYVAVGSVDYLDFDVPPGKDAKQIILTSLWRYLALDIQFEAVSTSSVKELLPLIDALVQRVEVQLSKASDTEEQKIESVITPYDERFIDERVISDFGKPIPSVALKQILINKIFESEAYKFTLEFYLDRVGVRPYYAKDRQAYQPIQLSSSLPLDGNIPYGFHMIGQLLNVPKQFSSEDLADWERLTGQPINREINQYGIDLTEIQLRVVEVVFKIMAQTGDKGNLPPVEDADILKEHPAITEKKNLPRLYRYVDEIPRLKIGKRELVKLAGMDDSAQSDTERVLQALGYLAATQFCFYYTRLALDEKGQPIFDKKTQKLKKEEVTAVDTLLKVRMVKDEQTKEFSYYEISPSALFLDQKSNYFMLVPFNWREEVRKLVGEKKASSYLYLFLMYLRYQFEQKRRKNASPQQRKKVKYTIELSWVEIAKAIRMPETVYRRNKARALSILEDAYSSAKTLGYLSDYRREEEKDILLLNPDKYPTPKGELEPEQPAK